MADTVTTQTIVDTQHRAVLKFTNLSGAGDGESAVTKVDLTALKYYKTGASVKITQAQWAVSGTKAVRIIWNGAVDKDALLLTGTGHLVFNGVLATPIENNSTTPSAEDHIQFTTVGWATNDVYSIVLELKKEGFDGWKNNQIIVPRSKIGITSYVPINNSSTIDLVNPLTLGVSVVTSGLVISGVVSDFIQPNVLTITFLEPYFTPTHTWQTKALTATFNEPSSVTTSSSYTQVSPFALTATAVAIIGVDENPDVAQASPEALTITFIEPYMTPTVTLQTQALTGTVNEPDTLPTVVVGALTLTITAVEPTDIDINPDYEQSSPLALTVTVQLHTTPTDETITHVITDTDVTISILQPIVIGETG